MLAFFAKKCKKKNAFFIKFLLFFSTLKVKKQNIKFNKVFANVYNQFFLLYYTQYLNENLVIRLGMLVVATNRF